jgi:hypothetical protein
MSDNESVDNVEYGEVVLNNVPLRVLGPVGYGMGNAYGNKTRQGDPGPDDHPVDNTISVTTHTGGMGTLRYRGDESRGNYWFSDLWTLTQDTLALNIATEQIVVTGTEQDLVIPHDKIGGFQWISFGDEIKRWIEADLDVDDPGGGADTFGASPVAPGVTWGDDTTAKKMYVPCGSSYRTWDGAAEAAGTGGEGAISFAVWQSKLFKLGSDGVVKVTTDGTTWTIKGTVPEEYTPEKLWLFYDKQNREVLHVSTSGKQYALDYENAYLVPTDFKYPDGPDQGKGATVHRTDGYVSVGLGIHRNTNGLIQAVGLDGRDGVPAEYDDGSFVDLASSYNLLMGLVRGAEEEIVEIEETSDLESGPPYGHFYSQTRNNFAMLVGHNGFGWYKMWEGVGTPTNLAVSSSNDVYRVFIGTRGALYTQPLPTGYYNPLFPGHNFPLERYGRHYTPYYDWGFVDTPKILKKFELKTRKCDENNYIKVWMRTDDNEAWGNGETDGIPLATITTNGQHNLRVGYETIAGENRHVGLAHERVQFYLEFFGDPTDVYATPVVEWFSLIGRVWMRAIRIFNFQADFSMPYKDVSTKGLFDAIFFSITKKGAVPLTVGGETFMVDVTSNDGSLAADMSFAGFANLSCVEIEEIGED